MVRFFVDSPSSPELRTSRKQAVHLMQVLGAEQEPPDLPMVHPATFQWSGAMNPEAVMKKIQSVCRQLTSGHASEFVTRDVPSGVLADCLMGINYVAYFASVLKTPMQFSEEERETPVVETTDSPEPPERRKKRMK